MLLREKEKKEREGEEEEELIDSEPGGSLVFQ